MVLAGGTTAVGGRAVAVGMGGSTVDAGPTVASSGNGVAVGRATRLEASVKVSRTMVSVVRKVFSGRLRMPEMPIRIADIVVELSLSIPCTVEAKPCIARISCLIFPIKSEMVMTDSNMITNARKMTIGAEARENAGCVKYRIRKVPIKILSI